MPTWRKRCPELDPLGIGCSPSPPPHRPGLQPPSFGRLLPSLVRSPFHSDTPEGSLHFPSSPPFHECRSPLLPPPQSRSRRVPRATAPATLVEASRCRTA